MFNDFKLEVFKTAATELNFSKAAKKLRITQPAVSMHITELENMMGDKLFTRVGNSMRLTSKGKLLLEYADRILHLYEMLNEELMPRKAAVPERLRIYADNLSARYILPEIIENFKKVYKHIELTLLEREEAEIFSAIQEGKADLGIVRVCKENGLRYAPLAKLSVSNSTRPYIELFFTYSEASESLKSIQNFILSSNTLI